MEIKDANGNIILSETYDSDHPERYLVVADSSYHFQEIMGDNNIVLNFSLTYFIEFPIGSTINFQYTVYTMLTTAHFTKQNERQYDYTLTFESAQKQLARYKFRNMVDGRLNFTLTAQPQEFLEHIVWNLNARENGNRWQVGEVVVSAEKTQSFSQNYLLDALSQVAQLFETEWEIVGTTINLRKVEYNKTETKKNRLEYGRGNGFISGISRQNSGENAVDVLWVEGGDRNIDSQTYTYMKAGQMLHANKLRLPKNEYCYYVPPTVPTEKGVLYTVSEINRMAVEAGMTFPDYVSTYLSNALPFHTDVDGFGIFRETYINGGYEDSLDLTEIYPKKVLYCGEVMLDGYTGNPSTTDIEKISNRFWDIQATTNDDTGIPNYNDCLIGGQDVTIVFNTGMLAGKEFNLANQGTEEKPRIYDPATQKFLIQPAAIDGITMPDLPVKYDDGETYVQDKDGNYGTGYVPRARETAPGTKEVLYVGDEFAVFHVSLPKQYIDEAERELLLEGCHYLWQHSEVEVEFSGTVDGIWAKNKWESLKDYLKLGGYINFYDNDFCRDGRMLRILSVKTYLNNPHSPELTLSNSSVSQSISSEIKKIPQNQVYTDFRIANITQYARRSFRDQEETRDALQKWATQVNNYFTSGISPVTVQTMQLLVGDKSLQYEFGVATTDSEDTVTAFERQQWSPYWDDGKLICPLVFDSGDDVIMRHRYYTVENGNGGVMKQYTEAEFPYWQFAADTQNEFAPPNPQYPYYLYIVAPKTAVTEYIGKIVEYATFELVEITGDVELPTDTPSHYYLLCGILNAERDGARSYTNVYGSVEITGGQVRLDEAISQDGDNYIDFINMIFKGDVNIVDGALASELIIGADKSNNFGGLTGGDLYDGDAIGSQFEGKKVRFWMGARSGSIRIVEKTETVETIGHYGISTTVEVTRKYIYGAYNVMYEDSSFRFGPVQYAWYPSMQISGYDDLHNKLLITRKAMLADGLLVKGYTEIQGNTTIQGETTIGTDPRGTHDISGIIKDTRYISFGNAYKGIVPVLMWSGVIEVENRSTPITNTFFQAERITGGKFDITVTKASDAILITLPLPHYNFIINANVYHQNKSQGYCSFYFNSVFPNDLYIKTADDSSQNWFDFWLQIYLVQNGTN